MSVIAVVLAHNSQTTGYEVSIYSSTPLSVWVLIVLNTIISIVLLMLEARKESGKRWFFPLGILVINGIIVLSMSVIRGYYAIGSDTLMHIGYVRDLANGIISSQNVYPGLHIIPAGLVKIGILPEIAVSLSPAIWYLIYISSCYGLAVTLWQSHGRIVIATMFCSLLFIPNAVGLTGTSIGVLILPLVLLVIIKLWRSFDVKHILLFIIIMIVMWVKVLLPMKFVKTCLP
jgi:hypothetical protein